jgi:hypothetical protein
LARNREDPRIGNPEADDPFILGGRRPAFKEGLRAIKNEVCEVRPESRESIRLPKAIVAGNV